MNNNTFELLAPAGSPEIFKAVIAAGADAVYVGGDKFGARAYADNFSEEELIRAIDYAHLYGRKLYLTVNTLIKNKELKGLFDHLLPLYERGLDAVLVQDIGAMKYIKENFPGLAIHTSTQMTVTGAAGAKLLKEYGAERIVMAREVSLAEMRHIHDETGIELEAFVHGALCYCYSGQCLMSSMLGGRSGNRGRCAQPCRLPYTIDGKKTYVLSLKDLCGIEDLCALEKAGVYSLKIEGRMKQADYAAGVVSVYRRAIDKGSVSKADIDELFALGNRCGFTDGYYHRHNGADMVTFVKPNYEKTGSFEYNLEMPRIKASGKLTLRSGEEAIYEVKSKAGASLVSGMEVMAAKNKPLSKDEVIQRLKKTGDTPFAMDTVEVDMDEGVFLPNGALNQIRREALNALQESILMHYRRKKPNCKPSIETSLQCGTIPKTAVLTENRELLDIILSDKRIDAVYLDYFSQELIEDARICHEAGKKVYHALPRIIRDETYRGLETIDLTVFDGFIVRNYEGLEFVRDNYGEKEIIADSNLYTYNDMAEAALCELGADHNTVPLELNSGEIAHRDNCASEMVIYGHYPLMTSAQCVHANTDRCDKKPTVTYIKDRFNTLFPVKNHCSSCTNVIYNSLPVMLFEKLQELKKCGLNAFRLDFTVENKEETRRVLALFDSFCDGRIDKYPKELQDKYTNGHYKRGVE